MISSLLRDIFKSLFSFAKSCGILRHPKNSIQICVLPLKSISRQNRLFFRKVDLVYTQVTCTCTNILSFQVFFYFKKNIQLHLNETVAPKTLSLTV